MLFPAQQSPRKAILQDFAQEDLGFQIGDRLGCRRRDIGNLNLRFDRMSSFMDRPAKGLQSVGPIDV